MILLGVTETMRRLANVADASNKAVATGMSRGVLLGQSVVRGNASGRPGPRVRTGDFRRSIVGDVQAVPGKVLGQIGTNKPQGRRLEYGFVGVDALGRRYNQPPFPYMQPSVPEVERAVVTEIANAIGQGDL